jgi:hypothetical protein
MLRLGTSNANSLPNTMPDTSDLLRWCVIGALVKQSQA